MIHAGDPRSASTGMFDQIRPYGSGSGMYVVVAREPEGS